MGREYDLDKFEKKKRGASKKQKNDKSEGVFKPIKNVSLLDVDFDEADDFEHGYDYFNSFSEDD